METFLSFISQFINLFLHLDVHLQQVILQYGSWTYALLFIIIFCETGLVVTPILPGDSLLFAAGTFAAAGSLSVFQLLILLTIAAVGGDAVNYAIGHFIGPKVWNSNYRWIKREYLEKTQRFYERYGGKTIIMARFVPIVRTFAPFLAGVGEMSYVRFASFNIAGGVLWISLCLFGGYFFGNLPLVRNNFSLVLLAVVGISVLPALIAAWRERSMRRA